MRNKKYNVRKFLSKYKVPHKIVSGGHEANLNCIFHEDYKYKMYLNLTTGMFNCFVCNERGSLAYLVAKYHEKNSAYSFNLEDFEVGKESLFIPMEEEKQILFKMPENLYFLSDETAKNKHVSATVFDYLKARKISDEQIYFYKLCISEEYFLRERIIFPVIDDEGNFVSYVARTYTDRIPKVMTPKAEGNYGIKEYVYNLPEAKKTSHLIITEGVFDCLSVGTSGIALFGKAATMPQLAKIIKAKPRRITICLDPDASKDAIVLYNQLIFHVSDIKFALLPEDEDPNSISKELLETTLTNTLSFSQFYERTFVKEKHALNK